MNEEKKTELRDKITEAAGYAKRRYIRQLRDLEELEGIFPREAFGGGLKGETLHRHTKKRALGRIVLFSTILSILFAAALVSNSRLGTDMANAVITLFEEKVTETHWAGQHREELRNTEQPAEKSYGRQGT